MPLQYSTIQNAIVAAQPGDTVLVAPGTYFERVDFIGKSITLRSSHGPAKTIIDGGMAGTVVSMTRGESAVLDGFTIQHGRAYFRGGGILIVGSNGIGSPVIRNNRVRSNRAGAEGAGIAILVSNPQILQNVISQNSQEPGWYGGGGGGIAIISSSATIVGNQIEGNVWKDGGFGAGIFSYGTETTLIMDNVVRANRCDCQGGGLGLLGFGPRTAIVQNLVVENVAKQGGGFYWPAGFGTVMLNTVAGNVARLDGSAFFFDARGDWTTFENNLLIGAGSQAVVGCGYDRILMPVMRSNNIFSSQGPAFGPTCADLTETLGNLSVDPQFTPSRARPYRLSHWSPAIDAGGSPDVLPNSDLDGGARMVDGNRDGLVAVDLGAFEYPNASHH